MMLAFAKLIIRAAVVIGLTWSLSGCYYMQAARGQLDVMNRSETIEHLIASPQTPSDLKERLQIVEIARQFSIDELKLADNDSYRSYADVDRDYVVWNVFAAPEFSLQPKRWCFPVAGCVSYRGYFSEDAARRKAERLKGAGFDVAVGGVAAYSTRGKLSDPVLNTMMHWDDVDLVALLFHELAHQKLYVKGDSEFNESFATSVEEIGIERWLASRGIEQELDGYRERKAMRKRLLNIVEPARANLRQVYASGIDVDDMRAQKQQRLKLLNQELKDELDRSGRASAAWFSEPMNNARLASMAIYLGRLPEFRALLTACNDDIECFYERARELAGES